MQVEIYSPYDMRNVWWICKAWPPPLLLEASFEPSYASLQRPPEISPLLLSPSPEPRMVIKRNTPTLPTHHYHFLLTGLLARAAARPAIREAIRCNWGPWEKRLNSCFRAKNERMQRHLVKTQRFDLFLCDVVCWQLDRWNLTWQAFSINNLGCIVHIIWTKVQHPFYLSCWPRPQQEGQSFAIWLPMVHQQSRIRTM